MNEQNTNAYLFPSIGDEDSEEEEHDDDSESCNSTSMLYSFPQKTPRRRHDSECSSSTTEDSERHLGETGRFLISNQGVSHIMDNNSDDDDDDDDEVRHKGIAAFSIATATTPGRRRRRYSNNSHSSYE